MKTQTQEKEVHRFTVTNDKAGRDALKHLRELTRLHNEAERKKSMQATNYQPKIEKISAIGRIGRNLLVGPRYRKMPKSSTDRSQEKHTATLDTARTIDVYVYA